MKGIYSGLYVRNDTSNLINFNRTTDGTLGHIIQGSTLHCYKDGNTTPTIYFYAPISQLTDDKTYYIQMKREYGSNYPTQIAIVNSSDSAITAWSYTSSYKSFTKTSSMDRIRIEFQPTDATSITVMLTDTQSKVATYVPYMQHVAQIANGSNYVEIVYRGNKLLYYDGTVIRYKTVGNGKQTINTSYGYYIDAHISNNDSTHYQICTQSVIGTFPGKIFNSGSYKVNWLVIPDTITTIDNSYKINNLNSTGDVYIHKDCNLLTYSEFMANFKGWNVWLYDSDYKDIIGHTDMTIGNYGYGN